jgi:hypothetical protein
MGMLLPFAEYWLEYRCQDRSGRNRTHHRAAKTAANIEGHSMTVLRAGHGGTGLRDVTFSRR